MDAAAPPHNTVHLSQKASATTTKPTIKPRTGAANIKPGVAKPDPSAGNNLKPTGVPRPTGVPKPTGVSKPTGVPKPTGVSKPTGVPKPTPSATAQITPAQLGKAFRVLGLSLFKS